ncbi:putative EG45-like domain containing protein 1 [Syzygium oleosum]|uniref:putative EG45-like domain containing protein 1 n=1 Tax=Syzygium oleosum TaxID=219896 RepID=UPI0024BB58E6|nr:putative EG45-like domain containing protein 1 [Syzygium oleosum]
MAANHIVFVLTLFALVFSSIPLAILADSGTATFYQQYVPSACYGNQPQGTMIAAASDTFWAGGAVCGKKYRVTCTGAAYAGIQNPCLGRSVVVKIVDHCPAGCTGSIDLSKEAFATIANPVAGIVKVTYDR